ncbi:MAG TPA: efflux RND transporter periplasmic adaptor subunit [Edaphocola sp.]|nr:efflux RND transporter periplasmic adaptor subunit [Edaphocola sp.]
MAIRKKRLGLWIGVLVGLIFLLIILKAAGCIGGSGNVKVAVEAVAYHDITETVDASGKVYPETEVRIKADVSGEIVELPVIEGDSVVKGQLLMKIDPVIYKTQVSQSEAQMDQARSSLANARQMAAQAKAQYQRAEADYERNKTLYKNKVISASEFEQLKSNYLAARANYQASKATVSGNRYGVIGAQAGLSQSQENLNRTVINSPTSGIISQLLVKNGERVVGTQQMDGTQVMTIADLGHMEVRVDVSETDITKVDIGDTSEITVDAYRNETFRGIVSKIAVSSVALNSSASSNLGTDANADQVTNYTVHILILPSSYQSLRRKLGKGKFLFKPGMSASVAIHTQSAHHVLAVPINAVTTRSPGNKSDSTNNARANDDLQTAVFVYDKANGKVKLKKVKTGIQNNEYIQVLSGVKAKDQVVIAPYSAIARLLEDGMPVSTVPKNELYESESKE